MYIIVLLLSESGSEKSIVLEVVKNGSGQYEYAPTRECFHARSRFHNRSHAESRSDSIRMINQRGSKI
jgi:hypothetical protein